jgi:hypothetical protein
MDRARGEYEQRETTLDGLRWGDDFISSFAA